jgi:Family of unknown function (DUF5706)
MSKKSKNIIQIALEYAQVVLSKYGEQFVFHNFAFIKTNVDATLEIGKAEGYKKHEYEMGVLALILKDLGTPGNETEALNNSRIIQNFIQQNDLEPFAVDLLNKYLSLFRNGGSHSPGVDDVLRDGADIFLSLPDAVERLHMLRIEREEVNGKTYSDIDWWALCSRYWMTREYQTGYAREKFGHRRLKNFQEIGIKLESARAAVAKASRDPKRSDPVLNLSNKETEDLFKTAFRNYVDLVSVADRKAGLLIQVNSILLSVVIAFTIRRMEAAPIYLIPTSILLISALITILNAILASMPQQQSETDVPLDSGKSFFFGSFDRVDPGFRNARWEEYETAVANMVNGDKAQIFTQIARETFQVRKILSRKFGHLAIAYKVFISGLGVGIVSFIIVAVIRR